MKSITFFTTVTLFLAIGLFGFITIGESGGSAKGCPEQTAVAKKYQIKSAKVTFKTEITGIFGESILYFDDYGAKELLEKYKKGILTEATLADGKELYAIKYDQKAAYKMTGAERGVAYRFDWNEISTSDRGANAKKLPNVTIAGKNCESYSFETPSIQTIYAGWKNICLLTELKMKMKIGKSITKADRIEENVIIPAEKFKIPAGFQIK